MAAGQRRIRQIRGYQPSYTSMLTQVATEVARLRINGGDVWRYAKALDTLLSIMPIEVKRAVKRKLAEIVGGPAGIGEVARRVYAECMESIEREAPRRYWKDKEEACLAEVESVLDTLFDVMFTEADEMGLWLVVTGVQVGGEARPVAYQE